MSSLGRTPLARPRRPRRLGISDTGSTSARPVKAAQHERSELGLYWVGVVRHCNRPLRTDDTQIEPTLFPAMKHRES